MKATKSDEENRETGEEKTKSFQEKTTVTAVGKKVCRGGGAGGVKLEEREKTKKKKKGSTAETVVGPLQGVERR